MSGPIETGELPAVEDGPGRRRLALAAMLVPAAMLAVLLLRRVWDVDIFWQLKLGEIILAHGGPISREPFAALHLGEPLPAVGWLAQASMALVRRIGGWDALRLYDALCWLGGFWAVAAACRVRGASREAVALSLILVFMAALPTASIRPQSYAALCFGLLLALQRLRLRPLATVALGSLLLLLWQNLHPSVSVAALALGLQAAVGAVAWLRDRTRPLPLAPAVLTFVAIGAMFATPDGFSILSISATNAEMSLAIGASEWRPLWIESNWINAVPVLVTVAVAIGLLLRGRRSVDPFELLLALALFALTLTAYRFVLFWAIAMVPVIARAASWNSEPRDRHMPRWISFAAVAFVAVSLPLLAPTRFAPSLPLEALAHLKRQGLRGTIYADFPYGGAVIDMGWPAWRVAYDGRYYRYAREEWRYNGGIENGYVPLVDVIAKWHPAAFVIQEEHNAPLAGELARSRRWQRIYRGPDGVVVFVRRSR
ncbi:hypothetical protein [Novosphingobium sp. ZW T3_23]|uniref:hypothetical protein n=1 Tax=Novosphingobium sp. ZW T3_23 TaxID=3378084 RepID=UPI003854B57B